MAASARSAASPCRTGDDSEWLATVARPAARPGAAALKEDTVAKLIYSAITSLDGYTADDDGAFDWAMPDEEVHAFVNDLERPVGTYLYGRGMYETMAAWETMGLAGEPLVVADFAQLWRVAEKIVYSTTLDRVDTRARALNAASSPTPSAAQSDGSSRPGHRRPRPCRPGPQGGPGRRVPPVRHARRGRRRHARAASPLAADARAARRAAVQQRRRASALSRRGLRARQLGASPRPYSVTARRTASQAASLRANEMLALARAGRGQALEAQGRCR